MGCTSSSVSKVSAGRAHDFHDCYFLGEKLGRGAFAQVRVAMLVKKSKPSSGSQYTSEAVKILDMRDPVDITSTDLRAVKHAREEASLWFMAKNYKHVVHLHDVFHDGICCYFVMERCTRTLLQHMERLVEVDERSIGNIVLQMLLGIAHVHSIGIIHRDVKPDNFMVGGGDGETVKLADFGLSVRLPEEGEEIRGYGGTAPFMCPEMVQNRPYNEKADVWSVGVLTYVFLLGAFPYIPKEKNSKSMKQAVAEGVPPSFCQVRNGCGRDRSTCALHFITTLLDRNPELRPSAQAALESDYMVGVRDGKHVKGRELPSLRPNLCSAKKIGAFECRNASKKARIDEYLAEKQLEKHGRSLEDADSEKSIPDTFSNAIFRQKGLQVAASGSAGSKVWKFSSSVPTTASGDSLAPSVPTTASCDSLPRTSAWSAANSSPARESTNSGIRKDSGRSQKMSTTSLSSTSQKKSTTSLKSTPPINASRVAGVSLPRRSTQSEWGQANSKGPRDSSKSTGRKAYLLE